MVRFRIKRDNLFADDPAVGGVGIGAILENEAVAVGDGARCGLDPIVGHSTEAFGAAEPVGDRGHIVAGAEGPSRVNANAIPGGVVETHFVGRAAATLSEMPGIYKPVSLGGGDAAIFPQAAKNLNFA